MMVSMKDGNVANNPFGVLVHKHYLADHVTNEKVAEDKNEDENEE